MRHFQYRPWGMIRWLMGHLPGRRWDFVGCLGTEERSITAWEELLNLGMVNRYRFWQVNDRPSRHSTKATEKLRNNASRLVLRGGSLSHLTTFDLFCRHSEIVAATDAILNDRPLSLVIDISVFPKRFFFPILKRILSAAGRTGIADIIVTYTIPESYPRGESLAENFSDDWTHLPLFGAQSGASQVKQLVVGVGFQALGLHSYLKGAPGLELKMLVPFPAPPAAFMRSWDLLRQIEQGGAPELFTRYRAGARDPSDTFDRLVTLKNSSNKGIALAPFGPKPMSLGMCVFACLTDSEVFYTQPSVYHPDYTIGVARREGVPEVYAYAIRIGGRNLYEL